MKSKYFLKSAIIAAATIFASGDLIAQATETTPQYPTSIALGSDFYAITSKSHKAVYTYSKTDGAQIAKFSNFELPVTGVAIDGDIAYVTSSYDKGELRKINIKTGETIAKTAAGQGAKAPLISNDKKTIYVCAQYKSVLEAYDAETLASKGVAPVLREPFASVSSADGKYIFVNNFLPLQPASLDYVAADVSVIDAATMTKVKDIKLDNGSNALRDITISPDGKYILVSHNLGRFQVPTSQLQQGWMNTSAVSVIDANTQQFLGSVLFDEPDRGAAGIWGISIDGDNMVVSHSGTHDVSILKYSDFKSKFESISDKTTLSYDLYFLYGMRKRLPLVGNGPRKLVVDGDKAYVETYFSDTLNVVNLQTQTLESSIALNPKRVETDIHKGEKAFNDASYCFQNWQSCNGCHPGEARTDGMNWDLMNDKIGNPKNCKSMLFSHISAPNMISGIRATAEIAVRAGFQHIQFSQVQEEISLYVDAYLKNLQPMPSPYLVNGELSELAKAGRTVFEKQKCDECHSGPLYTDMKMHIIGENVEFDNGWDTPTLREVWRTAPYLFDGRATTIEDVFEVEKHGINGKLSKKDLAALAEYVKSL